MSGIIWLGWGGAVVLAREPDFAGVSHLCELRLAAGDTRHYIVPVYHRTYVFMGLRSFRRACLA